MVTGIDLNIVSTCTTVDMDGFCGGSLIAPGVVLSAAHCGDDYNSVTVGAYQASGGTAYGAVPRTVVQTILHPSYNSDTEQNDFALHRLQSHVNMNTNVELLLNDESSEPQNNEDLTVLGLGDLRENGNSPDFLRDVVVKAISKNQCRSSYGNEVDGNTMICAGM
jgi:trypsin